MMIGSRHALVALLVCTAAVPAHADNPQLQALLFAACENPTGALAQRCAETNDAAGQVSTDSESSLNPSQPLSATPAALRDMFGKATDTGRGTAQETAAQNDVRIELGRLSLLTSISRTWEERDRTIDADNERGYDADTETGEVGFDYRLSDQAVAGLLVSYTRSELDFVAELPGVNFEPASSAGRVESDALGVLGYLSLVLRQDGYLDLSAGYQRGENDYRRNSVFQESGRQVPQTLSVVTGSADTQDAWASIDGGWQFSDGAWTYGTYGGLTLSYSEVDRFDERDRSGSGLAMTFSDADQRSLTGTLGLRAQRAIGTGWGVLVPYGRVAYSREFIDDPVDLRTGYLLDAGGNTLELEGDDPDAGFFTAALGATAVLPNGWVPFLDVSYWAGYDDLDRIRVHAGLRKEL